MKIRNVFKLTHSGPQSGAGGEGNDVNNSPTPFKPLHLPPASPGQPRPAYLTFFLNIGPALTAAQVTHRSHCTWDNIQIQHGKRHYHYYFIAKSVCVLHRRDMCRVVMECARTERRWKIEDRRENQRIYPRDCS